MESKLVLNWDYLNSIRLHQERILENYAKSVGNKQLAAVIKN